ncbi:hypothetical protein J6590_022897 [Homalodisca vitripennis]|nr:hypothetical protein J6590_022897 [Homalodisca vitripennis]
MSKCALTRDRDIHGYETRGRNAFRTGSHRTGVYEHLPSKIGVVEEGHRHSSPPVVTPRSDRVRARRILIITITSFVLSHQIAKVSPPAAELQVRPAGCGVSERFTSYSRLTDWGRLCLSAREDNNLGRASVAASAAPRESESERSAEFGGLRSQ